MMKFHALLLLDVRNAGKSSLINAFIGEDRNIVTDIAGTTRDSITHATISLVSTSTLLILLVFGARTRLRKTLSSIRLCVLFVVLRTLMYVF